MPQPCFGWGIGGMFRDVPLCGLSSDGSAANRTDITQSWPCGVSCRPCLFVVSEWGAGVAQVV
jgi:hypothetical protein